MLFFILFFTWYLTLVPLFLLIIFPFYNVKLKYYGKYIFNALKIKHTFIKESEYIQKGFILANHRCYFDFFLDTIISESIIIGRRLAFLLFLFGSLYLTSQTGIIVINRGKDSRKSIFNKILNYFSLNDNNNNNNDNKDNKDKRILFFPEGTRLRHQHIDSINHVKEIFRYGLLKEIYYYQHLPVQIQMSNNKELVIDERKYKINKNVVIKTHLSKPIYPKDYITEQEFYDAVAKQWYHSWLITHTNCREFQLV